MRDQALELEGQWWRLEREAGTLALRHVVQKLPDLKAHEALAEKVCDSWLLGLRLLPKL
ncbi:hypothetical protein [Mumia zhuanghuii]|uniref:hypothetical protein n=1 Tax=Mumia zhuanghuii TaxID=2585211 RepID=UPI00129C25D6|nr:hypothetical protein [Mumia zhuanghuii]